MLYALCSMRIYYAGLLSARYCSPLAAILYSGGLSVGIAVVIWNFAVSRVGATHTAVYGNLVPLVALTGSFLLLNERVTVLQLMGGTLIISGLLLMRHDRKHTSRAA